MSLDAASVGLYNGTAPHRRSLLRRSSCPSRGNRDRVHRDPRRPREQPPGRLAAHPEAPDHDLHRRLGLGEVVDRLRHDRDRGAAPALRELQPLHPHLPAALPAARRRRDREPEHGGDRRPEAPRRRLDTRRSARSPTSHRCCGCCSPGSASRTSATRTRSRSTTRRACAPSATASGARSASSSTTSSTARSRSTRARSRSRSGATGRSAPTPRPASSTTTRRSPTSRRRSWTCSCTARTASTSCAIGDKTMNATYLGVIEKIERAYVRRDIKTRSSGRRRRSSRTSAAHVPAVQGRAAQPGGARVQIDGHNIAELAAMEVGDLIADPAGDRGLRRRADRRDARRAAPGTWSTSASTT